MKKKLGEGVIGISAPLQVLIPRLGNPGVLDPWRGSVTALSKLLAIGK